MFRAAVLGDAITPDLIHYRLLVGRGSYSIDNGLHSAVRPQSMRHSQGESKPRTRPKIAVAFWSYRSNPDVNLCDKVTGTIPNI